MMSNFIATQRWLVMPCRPSEAVLSDSNLAWAITQTLILKRSQDLHSYDFKEWEALRNVNAAFREAVECQPLTVHLPGQLDEEGKLCLQQTKLPIAELYCVPGDKRVIHALLSERFRCVMCATHGNLRLSLRSCHHEPLHVAEEDALIHCAPIIRSIQSFF